MRPLKSLISNGSQQKLAAIVLTMDIIRQVDIFDNQTELLVQEVPVDSFNLETFRKRFEAKSEDPLMYNPYEITYSTIDLFPKITFDFEKYSYYVACYQV